MLCILFELSFERLKWCLDVWLNSLIIAFNSMCFSLLEKPHLFKLDTSSTYIISIKPSTCDLDRFSIHQDFWVISQ